MGNMFESDYKGKPFQLFGTVHVVTLLVLLLFAAAVIILVRRMKSSDMNTRFRYGFAFLTIFLDVFYYAWSVYSGFFSVRYALPLHICDAAVIFSAVMLLSRNYFIYEITYFWGLVGSLQALLTPDIAPYNFPHYVYLSFFTLHGFIITSVLYMTFVEGFRPRLKSILKTFVFTNLYMGVIAIVNIITDGNYLFICRKPANPSIMDFMGPWPWYILVLEAVGPVLFLVVYSPFAVKDFLDRRIPKKPTIGM